MELLDRITSFPDLCNGRPTIRGLRITVHSILEHMAAGDSMDEILSAFPQLEQADIFGSLAFAAKTLETGTVVYKIAG